MELQSGVIILRSPFREPKAILWIPKRSSSCCATKLRSLSQIPPTLSANLQLHMSWKSWCYVLSRNMLLVLFTSAKESTWYLVACREGGYMKHVKRFPQCILTCMLVDLDCTWYLEYNHTRCSFCLVLTKCTVFTHTPFVSFRKPLPASCEIHVSLCRLLAFYTQTSVTVSSLTYIICRAISGICNLP